MMKFKIGDKAVYARYGTWTKFEIGQTVEITAVNTAEKRYTCREIDGKETQILYDQSLDPYPGEKPKSREEAYRDRLSLWDELTTETHKYVADIYLVVFHTLAEQKELDYKRGDKIVSLAPQGDGVFVTAFINLPLEDGGPYLEEITVGKEFILGSSFYKG